VDAQKPSIAAALCCLTFVRDPKPRGEVARWKHVLVDIEIGADCHEALGCLGE
jgi:hypothetical protein